jgi:anti-sigma B factor antagonist
MRLLLDHHCLEAEQIGQVLVVTFVDRELLEETAIQAIGEQLAALVERLTRPQLVLNLGGIEKLSTMLLSKIVALHKKVRAARGRLALCGIEPRLYEIFDILKLPHLLPIYVEEQEALQTF